MQEPISTETVTRSADETFALGYKLASRLSHRGIILLTGELGTGKTVFTKGLASGLGIDPADVTSPSFTLINRHDGRLRLYHMDLYRLDAVGGWQNLGLEEIFDEENSVVVIEWGERLGFIPQDALRVNFEYVSDTERRVKIEPTAPLEKGSLVPPSGG